MESARKVTIEPITRLEGHGRIEIFLDGQGQVEHAYFQVPELRGFEKFAQGRPAEDMPQITSRVNSAPDAGFPAMTVRRQFLRVFLLPTCVGLRYGYYDNSLEVFLGSVGSISWLVRRLASPLFSE